MYLEKTENINILFTNSQSRAMAQNYTLYIGVLTFTSLCVVNHINTSKIGYQTIYRLILLGFSICRYVCINCWMGGKHYDQTLRLFAQT